MRGLPLEMGKAGLGLISFIFVMCVGVLALSQPALDSAQFVLTTLMLAVSVTVGAVLLFAMRRKVRGDKAVLSELEGDSQ